MLTILKFLGTSALGFFTGGPLGLVFSWVGSSFTGILGAIFNNIYVWYLLGVILVALGSAWEMHNIDAANDQTAKLQQQLEVAQKELAASQVLTTQAQAAATQLTAQETANQALITQYTTQLNDANQKLAVQPTVVTKGAVIETPAKCPAPSATNPETAPVSSTLLHDLQRMH